MIRKKDAIVVLASFFFHLSKIYSQSFFTSSNLLLNVFSSPTNAGMKLSRINVSAGEVIIYTILFLELIKIIDITFHHDIVHLFRSMPVLIRQTYK